MKNTADFPQIERIADPSKILFNEMYGNKSVPVVLTNITKHWPAISKWTPEYLVSQVGQLKEQATRVADKNDRRHFTIAEYIQYMQTTQDVDPYYLKNCQFHLKTDMVKDYHVPDYFESCLQQMQTQLPMQFQLSWMFIGTANTYSGLHLDIFNTSAWNAVITGKKYWMFYPPEQAKFLYNGQVNPFNPDLEKFPEFKNARPLVCEQGPGEVVFTPSKWWHAVFNVEAGISLTENYINETNYDIVRATLLHYQKHDEIRIVEECMTRLLEKENTSEELIF
jgi:histone arginine demethylase JMJD6